MIAQQIYTDYMNETGLDAAAMKRLMDAELLFVFATVDQPIIVTANVPISFLKAFDDRNLIPGLDLDTITYLHENPIPLDFLESLNQQGLLVSDGPELVRLYREREAARAATEPRAADPQ